MEPLRATDPRQVGPYLLTRRLGGGGMGQVFLGTSRGGRLVAVKVVRPELAGDPEFRRRFAREVAAAGRVGGFYTAQVVDADPDADPPWLVTAYVPGPSLAEAIDQHGPLPERAVTVLGAGLAEGLAAIHGCDIIHRDLKPSNVILAPDGPRVIDFGIAHALDATRQQTAVLGTPAFMSPEQVVGTEIGPGSDIFSLGCVLAYAVTGVSPFGVGRGHTIMYRIVYAEPDLAGVPPNLAPLIAACLAKNPDDRPDLATILDRLASRSGDTAAWLPPPITEMITSRALPDPDRLGAPPGALAGPPDIGHPPVASTPVPPRSHRPAVIAAVLATAVTAVIIAAVLLIPALRSGHSPSPGAADAANAPTTVTATPTSNATTVTGQLSCASGNLVVGAWVAAQQGSGFAFIRLEADGTTSDYQYTLPIPEPYTLHIGCGGTSRNWAVACDNTPQVSGTQNSLTCNDIPSRPGYRSSTRR